MNYDNLLDTLGQNLKWKSQSEAVRVSILRHTDNR